MKEKKKIHNHTGITSINISQNVMGSLKPASRQFWSTLTSQGGNPEK